jgi:peroxiredoxin
MNNFEGDPKVYITANGADLAFRDGQPVMDRGLENAVVLSLHSRKWFGNLYLRDVAQKLNGRFEVAAEGPITLSNLANIENAAISDLQPLIDTGVASRVRAATENNSGTSTRTVIAVSPPGADLFTLVATRHGNNWISQALDPAYLRQV